MPQQFSGLGSTLYMLGGCLATSCMSVNIQFYRPSCLSSHPTMEVFKRKVSMTVEDMSFQESKFYTVTVGRKPSKATNYVKDVGEVSDLLMKLAAISVSGKLGRFCSMPSLAAMGPDSEEEEEEDD